ncbi:sterile alpha motif domain-containing protein 1 isoform X2 [Onthophagus taurus]|uniref:sterile alpha motif domain-containing protein 1 isoform X2 n=1 Tax=Onthophagus taurus TaxID=166361 RepID=UPI000C20EB81|nr:uncharacterized protein LOC111417104 isoform X2 [Onthophagus taurus]
MSEIKYKDHILEAIDQLRRRKARPDADRIFNALARRHNVNYADAKNALEQCVQNGCVLRVEYKGNISYRNAAKKFSHLRRDAQGEIIRENTNKSKFTGLLTHAIAELVLQEPDYLQWGVPGGELLKKILSKDSVRYTEKYVSILLDKEVQTGSLIKMENGNFLVGPEKSQKTEVITPIKYAEIPETSNVQVIPTAEVKVKKKPGPKPGFKKAFADRQTTTNNLVVDSYRDKKNATDNEKLRVGGRRKRAKKVFDPSDTHIPRKKRGRPIGSLNRSTIEKQLSKSSDNESRPESRSSTASHKDQQGTCSVCQGKKASGDRLVACRECTNKAHASCLNGDDMMLRMYPDNTWQCPHCKTCVICYETSEIGYLAVCSICADSYHMSCHQPQLTERIKPGTKWLCVNCQLTEQLEMKDVEIEFDNEDSKPTECPTPSSHSSVNSSPDHHFRSLQPSPVPLSPQTQVINDHRTSPSLSVKSDSTSFKDMDVEENIDPTIPDPTHWTYDEVYNYFAQYFPEEAKAFLEHQIDGRSLLLMKRFDVLTGLKLKLGPALKIYRHVLKLQYRRDDPKLYWL